MLMRFQFQKPLRGPAYRTRAFQEYIEEQPPERAEAIMAGERSYNQLRHDPGSVGMAAARTLRDTMEGYSA